ncbi:MAG: 50S ribosomal protein L32e [Methanoregula sp.]|jgi:large subunit ribosomal protein L32e|nr:50S ribosomal protein L32e [Methanoregula sp.]
MTTEIKRLIRVRVEKGATFKRDGYGKKSQLSDSWRKPRGQHNKQREQKKAKGVLPKPGFGSPLAVRGMHPSGFFEVLVSSVKELEGINPKTHAIRIGATIGERTRVGLQEKAIAEGFKVLNARTSKTGPQEEKIHTPAKVADKKKSEEKNPAKSKAPAAPVKKDTKKAEKKKAEKTPEAEEKKAPVKEKKSTKPKVEPAVKTPEKAKATTPEKSTEKSVKPKTEAPAEAKAKPKAAAKPKTKKNTESGVKKNE